MQAVIAALCTIDHARGNLFVGDSPGFLIATLGQFCSGADVAGVIGARLVNCLCFIFKH